jgi:hypothetical protein
MLTWTGTFNASVFSITGYPLIRVYRARMPAISIAAGYFAGVA